MFTNHNIHFTTTAARAEKNLYYKARPRAPRRARDVRPSWRLDSGLRSCSFHAGAAGRPRRRSPALPRTAATGRSRQPLLSGEYPASMRAFVGARLPTFSAPQRALLAGSLDVRGVDHAATASSHTFAHLLSPSLTFSHLLSPSLTQSIAVTRLLSPSLTTSHHLSPPLTTSHPEHRGDTPRPNPDTESCLLS